MEIEKVLTALRSREPKTLNGEHFKPAAVLVPIQEKKDGHHIVLTRRALGLNSHGGQIAFPGGRLDPTDAGPLEAALRESQEEVGIDPRDVRVLGQLDQVTAAANFLVTPFVGRIPFPYDFSLNPSETTEVFSVPVSALLKADIMSVDTTQKSASRPVYHFQYRHWDIWGATAKVIKQLLELAYEHKV